MKTKQLPEDVARQIVAAARRGKLTAGYLREALEANRERGSARAVEPSGVVFDEWPDIGRHLAGKDAP